MKSGIGEVEVVVVVVEVVDAEYRVDVEVAGILEVVVVSEVDVDVVIVVVDVVDVVVVVVVLSVVVVVDDSVASLATDDTERSACIEWVTYSDAQICGVSSRPISNDARSTSSSIASCSVSNVVVLRVVVLVGAGRTVVVGDVCAAAFLFEPFAAAV